jgi:hypothetical protein
MSNLIPAYSGQFVYAGHWFMTPEMREKRQQYDNFVQSAALAGEIGKLFTREKIRYAVVPKTANPRFLQELAALSEDRSDFGEHELFLIRKQGTTLARSSPETREEPKEENEF